MTKVIFIIMAVAKAGFHADYLAPCNSTSHLSKLDYTYCLDGVCQCPPNKAPAIVWRDFYCQDIVQIGRISTIEDHPWVISNASCLSSKMAVAKSCRQSPCYSGILFELLRSADEDGKFLDNCTITEVSSLGRFQSGAWTKNSIMDHLAANKTDLGLAIFNEPTLSQDVKAAVHFESILVGDSRYNISLGIAFPKSFNKKRADELDNRITEMTDTGRAGEIFDKYFLKDGPTLWKREKQLTTFKPRRVVYWV
ncbi:uncharacterized protein LOC110862759 isoform X2 [Folsomia candida]|uniref:uncharacterized protein LOC110862759 isoform X2 n=1 Tax=Folsomia candida TaxID=158441 RepID=UPI001604FCD0|nr:uncharacterized protein LOC110862759 isoform X2 [Folsomia candida]